jgi:hypothetical protein
MPRFGQDQAILGRPCGTLVHPGIFSNNGSLPLNGGASGDTLPATEPRMNIIQTIAIGLSLAFLVNCATANGARPVPIRSLAKGVFSGIRDAKQEIVRSADDWEKLWKQHGVSAGAAEKVPEVDFAKEMVIATTMGTKRTGGYSIEIVSAEAGEKTLKISVRKRSPPPGALTVQALTAPFHFVAVPRNDLKPEFVEAIAAEGK